MKKKITTLALILMFALPLKIFAQDVPPPPPPGHGTTGNQEGGRGPVGSGLLILMGLGSAYGGYKGYRMQQKKKSS